MESPFVFGRPVEPDEFIGRKRELRRLLTRVSQGGSVVVTGQPRIGKTSLLNKLLDDIAFSSAGKKILPILMTVGHLGPSISEADFWGYVTKSAADIFGEGYKKAISLQNLDDYFGALDVANKKIILAIDGAGWLLDNPRLGFHFWGRSRSLATRHRSLSLIVFSRLSSSQMQEQIEREHSSGSPVLNFALQVTLVPFSYDETIQLIHNYTSNSKVKNPFTPKDRRIIWQLSGGYPFLVQLAASIIWDARMTRQPVSEGNYRYLKNELLEIVHPHFWDVWRYLSPTAQAIGIMVALREIATYQKYNVHDLDEVLKAYDTHVRELQRAGLLLEQRGTVVLSSLSFGMWILRTQVGFGKEIPQPEEWLRQNEEIFGPVTRKQIDVITRTVERVYAELRESIVDLGEALIRARLEL